MNPVLIQTGNRLNESLKRLHIMNYEASANHKPSRTEMPVSLSNKVTVKYTGTESPTKTQEEDLIEYNAVPLE